MYFIRVFASLSWMTQYCSIIGILWILWIMYIFYPPGRFASNCIAKITGFGGCVLTDIDFLSYLFIYARSRLTVESVLCLALNSTKGPETALDSELFSLFPFLFSKLAFKGVCDRDVFSSFEYMSGHCSCLDDRYYLPEPCRCVDASKTTS